MAQWEITGIDRASGQSVTTTVNASSDVKAKARGQRLGLDVQAVRPPGEHLQKHKPSAGDQVVRGFAIAAVLLLGLILILTVLGL